MVLLKRWCHVITPFAQIAEISAAPRHLRAATNLLQAEQESGFPAHLLTLAVEYTAAPEFSGNERLKKM